MAARPHNRPGKFLKAPQYPGAHKPFQLWFAVAFHSIDAVKLLHNTRRKAVRPPLFIPRSVKTQISRLSFFCGCSGGLEHLVMLRSGDAFTGQPFMIASPLRRKHRRSPSRAPKI
jgi:hypothetical protein